MPSDLTSEEPRKAMTPRLKNFVKLPKCLFYCDRGLVNLNATQQITHLIFSVLVKPVTANVFVVSKIISATLFQQKNSATNLTMIATYSE